MPYYARDAARDASITVKRIHVYMEKTMEKQRNQIKKTGEKNQGDSLKTAVHCFTEHL